MTLLPRPRQELSTMAQRRAADNVRPHDNGEFGKCNPSRCLPMRRPSVWPLTHNCIICGFKWHGTLQTHCHLYEVCDRCHDETDPCDTAQQIAEEMKVQPGTWGPR